VGPVSRPDALPDRPREPMAHSTPGISAEVNARRQVIGSSRTDEAVKNIIVQTMYYFFAKSIASAFAERRH